MNRPRYHWIARLVAATLAAYALAHSAAILFSHTLIQLLHTTRDEAVMLGGGIGLALFIVIACYCFSARSVWRMWWWLLGSLALVLVALSVTDFQWGGA